MSQQISYRLAQPEEAPTLLTLLREHGPNPWNYLPEEGIRTELDWVAQGQAQAQVACHGEQVVGMAILLPTTYRPDFFQYYPPQSRWRYIGDVVVHTDFAGHGIGSTLLQRCITQVVSEGAQQLWIDRHEENLASAAMMRKAGFQLVGSYADPARRSQGSRRTSVLMIELPLPKAAEAG
ncbi:GNAT family N-acetyltransferase [Balneatrix alpica]|uniref:GNAT family N-acetyltransferase n=1 Tax=Balneatrix alpica TaxID=75684 RepID=UPI00273941AD|nr:GNAT family N-acetyltransferase [Balneatrix alpica]